MLPLQIWLSRIAILAPVSFLCLAIHSDGAILPASDLSPRMTGTPLRVLWVWERPEDMRGVDPQTTAIAYLDETIFIGHDIIVEPRRQPFAYPSNVKRIAVVRLEVMPGANPDSAVERRAIDHILTSAAAPGIAALQIDFDATRSQRVFYRDLLNDLRARMPKPLPLSMTALASWCSYDDWLKGLPVAEAVPMFFRMEPDRRRVASDRSQFQVVEPLCKSSVGVSTHEAWPEAMAGKRVYIFPDRGWHADASLLAERKLP